MGKALLMIYGLIAYAAFFGTILYAIGWVGDFVVPKAIDDGEVGSVGAAIAINVGLLAVFAIQHTIMARPAFKAWFTKIIPEPAERSTFVLLASAALALVFWQWRAMPTDVWRVDHAVGAGVLNAVYFFGWAMVFFSSFLIDHFDLFGLRQVWLAAKEKPYTHHPFQIRSLYRIVRHPLMTGFLIMSWAGPVMSQGRLLFAVVISVYIVLAVRYLEERDLIKFHGEKYVEYKKRTPMLIPFLGGRGSKMDDGDESGNG